MVGFVKQNYSRNVMAVVWAVCCCFGLEVSAASASHAIRFRVKVSDMGLQRSSLLNGKQPNDWVEVRLPGHLIDSPTLFSAVSRGEASWNTPISAAVADFSAFKADDKDWIVEDFVLEEKEKILELLNDKDSRQKNEALFQQRTGRFVTGEANYKEYSIVFVRDSGQPHAVPLVFKRTTHGYKRTNALSGDETFDIIFSALYKGEITTVE